VGSVGKSSRSSIVIVPCSLLGCLRNEVGPLLLSPKDCCIESSSISMTEETHCGHALWCWPEVGFVAPAGGSKHWLSFDRKDVKELISVCRRLCLGCRTVASLEAPAAELSPLRGT